MTDIERFIRDRKARNPAAWRDFEDRYARYAVGMMLAFHRERSGLSLGEFAKRVRMQKAAVSRLENHGEDVRLSTIRRYVQATGRPMTLKIEPETAKRSGAGTTISFVSGRLAATASAATG